MKTVLYTLFILGALGVIFEPIILVNRYHVMKGHNDLHNFYGYKIDVVNRVSNYLTLCGGIALFLWLLPL